MPNKKDVVKIRKKFIAQPFYFEWILARTEALIILSGVN